MSAMFKSASIGASLVAGGVLALSAGSAQAATLTAADVVAAGTCVGQVSCSVNGFNLSVNQPSGSRMTQKTVGGVLGIGISRDGSSGPGSADQSEGEIDLGEVLGVSFNAEKTLASLDLSFLYRPGVYADQVYEVAKITAGNLVGTLTVTGSTSAVWSLGGTVQNLSPSSNGKGGSYRIFNPFGDAQISGFTLTPVDASPNVSSFRDSDFTLSRVEAVPEPGTIAALAFAAASGLGLRRRRNQADQEA